MKAIVTYTPDIDSRIVESVTNLLNSIGNTINFINVGNIDYIKLIYFNKKFHQQDNLKSLSFREFFSVLKGIRDFRKLGNDDFLILLTKIDNDREWYSAFKGRDIFINNNVLTSVLGDKIAYGIAYQCVENIFQSLINLDINKYLSDPNIHHSPIGCINDYCDEENQVLIKLCSANICESCYNRATKNNVDNSVLLQIINTLEIVRKEFSIANRIKNTVTPEMVWIDRKGNVYIGTNLINLEIILKTIFIFFLKYPEGIPTKLLDNYENELFAVYKKLRKGADKRVIKNLCVIPKNSDQTLFEQKRSKLKKALKEQLSDPLYTHYTIKTVKQSDVMNQYKIELENKYINIDPKF